jgi:hypothetical protein
MYEQYSEEREKAAKLYVKIQNLERENKALEIRN